MTACKVCVNGVLEEQVIEKWLSCGEPPRWVLFANVPAIVCELCGETSFSHDVVARLTELARSLPDNAPTRTITSAVYDLARFPGPSTSAATSNVRTSTRDRAAAG
jgi:hypothetical protein